jgi:hypothetical protein
MVAVARAEDFCIHSKVTIAKETVETSTVFHSGRVYDFLSEPDEVTIFDPPGRKFVVLNPARSVKTEVSLNEIEQFSQKMKAEAMARPVALLAFLADPKFGETFDESTGELTLTSAWMDYEVKTVKPRYPEAVALYSDFTNWQTKLNSLMKAGSLPPFARLTLNDALARHQRLPTEVLLTRYAQHPEKRQMTIRAEHRMQWRLDDSDLTKIDAIAVQLAIARAVGLTEYRASIAELTPSE